MSKTSRYFLSLIFVLTILLSISKITYGAELYFKLGAKDWHHPASWSIVSAFGMDNAGVPGDNDLAVFTAFSGDCFIDSKIKVGGIRLENAYLGRIWQRNDALIVIGHLGFTQSGGFFEGSTGHIFIQSDFKLNGGHFLSTQNYLIIEGNFYNFTDNFAANNGTVVLGGSNPVIQNAQFNRLLLDSTVRGASILNRFTVNTLAFTRGLFFECQSNQINISTISYEILSVKLSEDMPDDLVFLIGDDFTEYEESYKTRVLNQKVNFIYQSSENMIELALGANVKDRQVLIKSLPKSGRLVLNEGKAFYSPNEDFYGEDSFTYVINDGEQDSNLATVSITVDDAYEKNDSFATATDLTSLLYSNSSKVFIPNLILNAKNEDYFKLTLRERSSLELLFLFNPGNGIYDLDVYLYDEQKNRIAAGETGNSNEYLPIRDLAAGVYYIKVHGWSGAHNVYSLTIERTNYSLDDRFEPNDSILQAFDLTQSIIEAQGQLFISQLSILPANQDFYKIHLNKTANLTAEISFQNKKGNLDLEILSASDQILAKSTTTGNTEKINLRNLVVGDYYIRVYGVANAANDYSMKLQSSAYVLEDSFEPNDTKAEAKDLSNRFVDNSLSLPNLQLNSFNEDWFKFTVTKELWAEIAVLFSPGNGEFDLDISLEDATGKILAEGLSGAPNEYINLLLNPGTYYLRIYGWADAHNAYALEISLSDKSIKAPIAFDETISIKEDTTLFLPLKAKDSAAQSLSYMITSLPKHGTLISDLSAVAYTPHQDFNGVDSFSFQVSNDTLTSNTATVTIQVMPVNDAPKASDDTVITVKNTMIKIEPLLNDQDIDGDPLVIKDYTQANHGTITQELNVFFYTPALNYIGEDNFSYTIQDPEGLTSQANVYISVANKAPIVLKNFVFESEINQIFQFNLAEYITYDAPEQLHYEIRNNTHEGVSVDSKGLIRVLDVGPIETTIDFDIEISDKLNQPCQTHIRINVVKELEDPFTITRLSESKIEIKPVEGASAFKWIRALLLEELGAKEAWLDERFYHTNILSSYAFTNSAQLPKSLVIEISPDETLRSQKLKKVGFALLSEGNQETILYETSDKIYAGINNQYEMHLTSQAVELANNAFQQGLNKIVVFAELSNGVKVYFDSALSEKIVPSYISKVKDENRSYIEIHENNETKYEYNTIRGSWNYILFDTKAPEIKILDTYIFNDKVVLVGETFDSVGTEQILGTLALKDQEGNCFTISSDLYHTVTNIEENHFNIIFSDKEGQSVIQSLAMGSNCRVRLNTRDFLGNESNHQTYDFVYQADDQIAKITSFIATEKANKAELAYQIDILDSNYELAALSINQIELPLLLAGTTQQNILQGGNTFELLASFKNKLYDIPLVVLRKSIHLDKRVNVELQDFIVTGQQKTFLPKIAIDGNELNQTYQSKKIATSDLLKIPFNIL